MAQLLNDKEIKKLFGTVIIDGDEGSIRPNSYILRLGGVGQFLDSKEEDKFDIGENKGIKLPAGFTVAVTALETIDFRQSTVEKIYPGCSLHGFLTPTTDLSREGMIVPSTQVDAGYHGTLNWSIRNSSTSEAEFVYGEKLFRLTILKLDKEEEIPEDYYKGDYQGKKGYVPSARKGPPAGMKGESYWVRPISGDSIKERLNRLISSGYPWNVLGEKLKEIDKNFDAVKEQYSRIEGIVQDIDKWRQDFDRNFYSKVREAIHDELRSLAFKGLLPLLVSVITLVSMLAGTAITIANSEVALNLLKEYSWIIGIVLLVIALIGAIIILVMLLKYWIAYKKQKAKKD